MKPIDISGAGQEGGKMLVPTSEVDLRSTLEAAVVRDLLGPAGGEWEEIADGTVRDRYLVGMLAPRKLRILPEEIDRLEVEAGAGGDDRSTDSSELASPTMFPSSIGLSFCVGAKCPPLHVTARWGRYSRGPSESLETEKGNPKTVWMRVQIHEEVEISEIAEGAIGPFHVGAVDGGAPTAEIRGVANHAGDGWVVSLFLVNVQDEPETSRDSAWIFQPELHLGATDKSAVFRSRPRHEDGGDDEEARLVAMLYRERPEIAVGHGVAVHATPSDTDPRRAVALRTVVVPVHEIPSQSSPDESEAPKLPGVGLDMKVLAEASDAELAAMLEPLALAYEEWIKTQRRRIGDPASRLDGFEAPANEALANCERALARIRAGSELLQRNAQARDAFRFANRAMWLQRIHTMYTEARRRGEETSQDAVDTPANRSWRLFQLAFVLLNLESTTDLHHEDRSDPAKAVADLLWFPTGGGKTEAYLGLAAYAMALRRLQGEVDGRSGEQGVAVLMRYTLRLLTLQQFQRAAALISAARLSPTARRNGGASRSGSGSGWGRAALRTRPSTPRKR